jgi:hypothetical protein
MLFRVSAGNAVELSDFGIQAGALTLFSVLLYVDRTKSTD